MHSFSLVVVHRLLIAVAFLVVEQGLQSAGSVLVTWYMVLVVLWHVGSSQTSNGTGVPCIARQILNNWTTREVHPFLILNAEKLS